MKNKFVEEKIQDLIESIISTDQRTPHAPLDAICDVSKLIKLYYDDTIRNKQDVEDKLKQKAQPLADEREEVNEVVSKFGKSNNSKAIEVAEKIDRNIESVVLIVQKKDLKLYTEKKYELTSKDLGKRIVIIGGKKVPFNSNIKLAEQRSADSLGTGFFYKGGEDNKKYVITAAHVIFPPFLNLNLSEIRFVKGFSVRAEDSKKGEKHLFDRIITIPKDQVFKPIHPNLKRLEDFELSSYGEDWAKIEIIPEDEREFSSNHIFLEDDDIESSDKILNKEYPVYGIGHGFGLPLKLSPCGKIVEDRKDGFFECSIDFFSGNSGTPVFDAFTHKLLGVLTRGKKDLYIEKDKTRGEQSVIPGVLQEPMLAGEVCQKITFTEPNKQKKVAKEQSNNQSQQKKVANLPIDDIIGDKEFPKELLPYIHIEKIDSYNYELEICLLNETKTVEFAPYPDKTGQITFIDCYLDHATPEKKLQRKKYILTKSEDTEETIEVRILDKTTGIYHIVDFSFDSTTLRTQQDIKLYWTMCIPEDNYYDMKKDVIGIGVGYFQGSNLITSNIKKLSVGDFENKDFIFDGHEGSDLKSDNGDSETIKLIINTEELYFSKPTSAGGINRKPTSVGGINRKPTRFTLV